MLVHIDTAALDQHHHDVRLVAVAPPDRRDGFYHHDTCDMQRQADMLADFVELAAHAYGFNPRCVVATGAGPPAPGSRAS
jgi:hypothetical protein